MDITFGEKIKTARKTMGLTQKQLAEMIGAKHNSISDWEKNKNKPDSNTIEALCKALHMTPNYLLGTESDDAFSPAEKKMIEKYRKLDAHGKEMIDFLLNKLYASQTDHMAKLQNAMTKLAADPKPILTRTLAYYTKLTFHADGRFSPDDLPSSTIEIPVTPENDEADFVLRINGDSMEPTFHDGDKVLVQNTDIVGIGDIGVFFVDDECHIKETGAYGLISHNPKYPLIPGTRNIRCVGRVLDKLN